MKKKKTESMQSFESGMKELEKIVARLESGDLPLEESLAAYEQGVGLVRRLNEKLGEAEKRIEILSRGSDSVLRVEEIDEDEL